MSITKEVTYFNSFLVKKVVESQDDINPEKATWPSFPWEPVGYPTFPLLASTSSTVNQYNWYVEEARIRGGYNNTSVDLGVKAFITESEDTALTLGNGLIYSGVYNSRTGVNETNVFSTGENITKELDPRYGNIQKMYTSDTNLILFQEDKVSMALIDKDAIYTADGNPSLTATQLVIGQINQYAGEYGISDNPESFAFKGYRMYFSDKNRGAIMRLSRDGLTEISRYGMRDYFRDTLADISEQFEASIPIVVFGAPASGEPTTTDTFTVTGDSNNNVSDLELGMSSSQPFYNKSGLYILDIVNVDTVANTADILINTEVDTSVIGDNSFQFIKFTKDKIVGAVIRDMSAPEVQKEEVLKRLTEVIDKNLGLAQQIGFILGEGTSETERMLNSIIESYKPGKDQKNR